MLGIGPVWRGDIRQRILNVQARSREAGCLTRKGRRCRGRGEAAGDCVDTAKPFRTAAVDRTVVRGSPHRTRYCHRRGLRPRPGSSGNSEQGGGEKTEISPQAGHRPYCGSRSRWSFCQRGSRRDKMQLFWEKSSEGGAPRSSSDIIVKKFLFDPGQRLRDGGAGDDKQASGAAGDRCEGGSFRSSATTRPRGDCEERRRVFPSGFPRHVEDFGPSHIFTVIPTAGGAASAAAAQPRIETAGGAVVRDLRVLRGSTRGGTGYHAHEMRCFRFCA